MALLDKIKKSTKKAFNSIVGNSTARYFDMSTVDAREATVNQDYNYAQTQRSEQVGKWQLYNNYYNSKHKASLELTKTLHEQNIPWVPAVIPDPYIHVESQIVPDIPDFEFTGRDDDLDNAKAKQREFVVKYVLDQNKLEPMNTDNERRLNILGDAFWKVSWDANKNTAQTQGDIVIGNPDPANIFPDPSATDLDDCEFIIYAYRLHRRAAARQFATQLKKLDITLEELGTDGKQGDTEIYSDQTRDMFDDTVQIVEYWFRQPNYGSQKYEYEYNGKTVSKVVEWEPGDIACSVQINNIEVQYIPKYWINTGKQCKIYPFVKYCKIPIPNSFWDKSDIESIIPLVDQCDRELASAILNDAFMANDIILMEQDAVMDNTELENVSGAIWKVKPNKINSVRRLGGVANSTNQLNMIEKLRELIQQTVGNFDTSQGQEPTRVTTASGIAQLNERADARKNIKKADRLTGFERLFELIDWTALEFYDDDRLIFIGAKSEKAKQGQEQMIQYMKENPDKNLINTNPNSGPVFFTYNSKNIRVNKNENEWYYPTVDCTVDAGDGIQKSKAFTLASTENLLKMAITPQNYKIVESMLDIMDLPNKKEIKTYIDSYFEAQAQAAQNMQKQSINITFKDLPMDAQQQLLQRMGIQSQMPPTLDQQVEMGAVQPQGNQLDFNDIFKGLSPEELQYLDQNPQELEKFVQSLQGGMQNGSQVQQQSQNLQG